MTRDFNFVDDLPTANARIAEHEARLGLPKSEARIDLLDANTVLRGLELLPTPAKPIAPAAQPPSTLSFPPAMAATGTARVARAYASSQPAVDLVTLTPFLLVTANFTALHCWPRFTRSVHSANSFLPQHCRYSTDNEPIHHEKR